MNDNNLSNYLRLEKYFIHLSVLLLLLIFLSTHVYAEPIGGEVVGGSGLISYQGNSTNINQASQRMAIDWQSFNVQSNESVNFIQPNANAVSLNRILDQNPSQIFGSINANGQVMLVNPNGIVFSPTSSVNVGGLVASGLDITPQSFMNGDMVFKTLEGTDGVVINRGLLNAATGGSISLLGKSVENEGLISAKLGRVNMASGSAAVATFDDKGLIGIEVTKEVMENQLGIDNAILNSGTIQAEGGEVLMTAKVSQRKERGQDQCIIFKI
jgi:filamentous hemagglutinin family protein